MCESSDARGDSELIQELSSGAVGLAAAAAAAGECIVRCVFVRKTLFVFRLAFYMSGGLGGGRREGQLGMGGPR